VIVKVLADRREIDDSGYIDRREMRSVADAGKLQDLGRVQRSRGQDSFLPDADAPDLSALSACELLTSQQTEVSPSRKPTHLNSGDSRSSCTVRRAEACDSVVGDQVEVAPGNSSPVVCFLCGRPGELNRVEIMRAEISADRAAICLVPSDFDPELLGSRNNVL
jgi:hypothetical protein